MAKTIAASKQNAATVRYDEETARQIAFLAGRWGQPRPNVSAIIIRCIERVYQQEMTRMDTNTRRITASEAYELFVDRSADYADIARCTIAQLAADIHEMRANPAAWQDDDDLDHTDEELARMIQEYAERSAPTGQQEE